MIYTVTLRESAVQDLLNISHYIIYQLNNNLNAKKIINVILSSIESLKIFPFRNRNLYKNIYSSKVENYKIYYIIEGNEVIIARIIYYKRNFNFYNLLN